MATAIILWINPFGPPRYINDIVGVALLVIIIWVDWGLLSKKLTDYYLEKMKKGRELMKYEDIFTEEWKKCLQSLNEFKESDAEQLKKEDDLIPLLFLLGSSYGNGEMQDGEYRNIAKAACSLELIYQVSIMVDDYIDGNSMRNGKNSFHEQYPDLSKMILLENAMLAKAQENFAECSCFFECDDTVTIDNLKKMSKIILDLDIGGYRELTIADFSMQSEKEIREIMFLKKISLIQNSMELGYSCFHKIQGNQDHQRIRELGKMVGYIFQCLDDMEPFREKSYYMGNKGLRFQRKNIALFKLYASIEDEKEKKTFRENADKKLRELYRTYNIEQKILDEIREEINKMKDVIRKLKVGNEGWVEMFDAKFKAVIREKKWETKVPL